ncbi:MAG: hypothetical protein L0Y74_08650 [candidate division Zixibacteria bacterium]|nr:hypothetical protein [candidate division Zixibacteria bacterium]
MNLVVVGWVPKAGEALIGLCARPSNTCSGAGLKPEIETVPPITRIGICGVREKGNRVIIPESVSQLNVYEFMVSIAVAPVFIYMPDEKTPTGEPSLVITGGVRGRVDPLDDW